MKLSHRLGGQSEGRLLWSRWRRLAAPSLFFLGVIYYEELFLKLYCFHGLSLAGAVFTLLFSIPIAMLLGALCGGVEDRLGRRLLVLCTALVSLWMGAQTVYYHLFKTFLTIFSLTKMMMVAGAFGNMAVGEILLNWFPILMMAVPVVLAAMLGNRLLPDRPMGRRNNLRWLALGLGVQLAGIVLVLFCGGGVLSLRYIYFQAAVPELEVQNFGMFTQTELEIRRVLFGIDPDDQILPKHQGRQTRRWIQAEQSPAGEEPKLHTMDIDFQALMERDREDLELSEMHGYFSKVKPTAENEWTGRFQGKNLVWIVAEGFSDRLLDPVRTPTLWKLAHEGIICDNFYTPLWGVSTSDGEYVTTTGLIPTNQVNASQRYAGKNGVSMYFSMGNQLRALGYPTLAYHNNTANYYDRNLSHPNLGYEKYYGYEDLAMENYQMDRYLINGFDQMTEGNPFFSFVITLSGHGPYGEDNPSYQAHAEAAQAAAQRTDGNYVYAVAGAMETDQFIGELVDALTQANLLEDTVLIFYADHYNYYMMDDALNMDIKGVDNMNMLQHTDFFIWSADLEATQVDKVTSSVDVLPTIANLFELDTSGAFLVGHDGLGDQGGYVFFSDGSWYDGETYWSSQGGGTGDPDRSAEITKLTTLSNWVLAGDYYRSQE